MMPLTVKYIPHALERMKERVISKELVEKALRSPDDTIEGYVGRKWRKNG